MASVPALHTAAMTLERFLKHERLYLAAALLTALFINGTIIATSLIMEAQRAGRAIDLRRPFIDEYSSHLAMFLCFAIVIWAVRRFPVGATGLRTTLLAHLAISVVFSICHIVLFVMFREAVYAVIGVDYRYSDDLLMSFVYEYRKDVWSYVLFLMAIHSYRFVISRLRGEAIQLAESEEAPVTTPDRFLVRKLGKEFLVRVDDVEWLEAAGNYVNLHVGERTYPLRATMTKLLAGLESHGFARIHRSHGVKLDAVESLTPLDSGDAVVTLRSGKELALSRRYRDEFRDRFTSAEAG